MIFATFNLLRNLQSKWKSNENISSQYFIISPFEIYCFACTNVFEKPQFSSIQSLSRVRLFAGTAALQASLSITSSQSLLKLISIETVMPSNHLILSSSSPPALNFPQHQGLFQKMGSLHQVAKVLELQHQSFK